MFKGQQLAALTAFFLLVSTGVFAQQTSKLTGRVLNKKNEPVTGATITVKGTKTAVLTDMEGRFSVSIEKGIKYTIVISYVGYQAKEISDVEVSDQYAELNVLLEESAKTDLGEVVVKASAKKESNAAVIQYQKNTNTVASVISAEVIRRSPDKNTGEVLKRIPGTSVQEGRYLVVRGLADRYNQAMLNGVLLTSTEPDRKTFSFDIFPAAMIDNIIMNKAFVPELPGEWAGGLVQVQTKDIPSKNFLNLQIGTGFNSQTISKKFLSYKGGTMDWLGIDDGTRGLPASMPTKGSFAGLSETEQAAFGQKFRNIWMPESIAAPMNTSFQINGGFSRKVFGKKLGGVLALTYNKTNRRTDYTNSFFANADGNIDFLYNNSKYSMDVLAGALANFTLQLNSNNKIYFRNLLNLNSSDYVIDRTGKDFILDPAGQNIHATELAFRQNAFFNTQIAGDHLLSKLNVKFKWYGSFNILDQYIPDQRRIQYIQLLGSSNAPYVALLGGGNSQKSGSRFFSFLNDYIYSGGGDLAKTFNWKGQKQMVKAGYMIQVKDRLFDSRPFFYQIGRDNTGLINQPQDQIFTPGNIGVGDNKINFGELSGIQYRYLANTILNAAFLQFDNQLGEQLRIVWGVRFESFDQLVGSVRQSDPRHVHTLVKDWLPGLNVTYKVNDRTNVRLSASQTVVRPEFRELSPFAFFDFELGATVLGNKTLQRTKVSSLDLRYELYPRAGELFTIGVFYKYFDKPIELYFNQSGAGSSNSFNFINADAATGFGVEAEIRKKLDFTHALRNFTAFGNLSYIYNRVKGSNIDRPMQGQSPYVINLGLQYDIEKIGLNTTVLFNQVGQRIQFVGNIQNGIGVKEIWEWPRPILDLQVAKKVLHKKGEFRLNISDILNRPAYFYTDFNDDGRFTKSSSDGVAIRRRFGTNISLTFAYTIK